MPKNPHADFTPALEGYSGQGTFRFWCQMALPLTYDDSLSYYELLCKVVNYLNHTIEDVANAETNVSRLAEAYTQLQNYVNNYFDDLDIEAELRNVLDAMAEDGTLDDLLDPLVQDHLPSVVDDQIDDVVADQIDDAVAGQIDAVVAEQLPPLVEEGIPDEVSDWLTENVDPVGSAVVVDSSLTISGAAADAKVTGDELADLKTQLTNTNGELNSVMENAPFDVKLRLGGFEIGGINTAGDNYVLTDRVRSIGKANVDDIKSVTCTVNEGYKLALMWYKPDRVELYNDYFTGTKIVNKPTGATGLRILIGAIDDSEADLSFVDEISIKANYYQLSDFEELQNNIEEIANKLYTSNEKFISYNLANTDKFNVTEYENKNVVVGNTSNPTWTRNISMSVLSDYTSYVFLTEKDIIVSCDAQNSSYYAIAYLTEPMRDAWLTDSSGTMYVWGITSVRYRKSESNLPTKTNPITIPAGSWVGVTVSSGTPIIEVKETVIDDIIKQRNIGEKYPYFDVEMHDSYIYYYMPTNSGKWLRYKFNHHVSAVDNADGWVQRIVDLVSEDKSTVIFPVVREGEWEMAIQIQRARDFIGCENHGSEVSSIVKFYFDGIEKEITDGTILKCAEIKVNEKSTMYNPGTVEEPDEETVVGYHYKTYKITSEGITIEQRIDWVENLTLDRSYIMMMPAVRGNDSESPNMQVTDTAYCSNDFVEYDVATTTFDPTGLTNPIWRGNELSIYGATSKISIDSFCFFKEKPDGACAFLSNAAYYNKWYFAWCGNNYTVNAGDVWEWTSKYIIRYEGK